MSLPKKSAQLRMTTNVSTEPRIPFNRASLAGNELRYVSEAVSNGHISGGGAFTRTAEGLLESISGSQRVLLTTSCTHALEMSARLLDLGPGDEVIVPAYTFVSTAAAFALTGAKPVFVDVTQETLNLDVRLAEAAITPRTRAICTVHYGGIAQGIDELTALCEERGLALVEDNAHGLGASFDGRLLGTFGDLSTLSFHETKNVTCGEGGALGINRAELVERAEILREKGTDRSRFLRGQVDKYTWVDVGSSWVASDMLAAFLVGQLEQFDEIQARRMLVWDEYQSGLASWARNQNVRTPVVPPEAKHVAHMYYLRMPSPSARDRFIAHMDAHGILAVFHYQGLHISDMGRRFGGVPGQCPVAEQAAETLVRLPLFSDLKNAETDRVIEAVTSFRV